MIDFARITVKAGDGGNGCGSFHKIKGKRYGKADGGNGGNGGSVYIEATGDLNTLEPFRYLKDYKAHSGSNGLSRLCRGAGGEDLVLKVPVGTVVRLLGEGKEAGMGTRQRLSDKKPKNLTFSPNWLPDPNPQTVYDLTEAGQKVLIARGGDGGRGNFHLRDEYGRRPKVGEKGQDGEAVSVTLELKLLADIGLIGLPNAGKSTLLSKLTAAKPKIASYPFTTLEPNLGVLRTPGDQVIKQSGNQAIRLSGNQAIGLSGKKQPEGLIARQADNLIARSPRQLVLADIPGLIEGASQGRGLGDLFLRHIERTKVLVHLIDVSSSQEIQGVKALKDQPFSSLAGSGKILSLWEDYQTIRDELKAYSRDLAKKKEIVVLTKVDLVDRKMVDAALLFFGNKRKKALAISAQTSEGLRALVEQIFSILLRINPGG